MAVTSCKDDDKDKNGGSGGGSGEEPALTPSETVVAKDAYTWLNILTDLEGFTDDWASKTYDPTTGKSSKGQVPGVPEANIFRTYDNYYNGNTILLTTGLGSEIDDAHNLTNLIWALLDPAAYHKTVGNSSGAIGLGGYEYQYNGEKFVKRVNEQWIKLGIWEKLFNRSYDQMKQFKKLNFYYKGKYWALGSTGDIPFYTAQKYEKTVNSTLSKDKDKGNYQLKEAGAGYDIRRYCSDPKQNTRCSTSGEPGYAPAQQFSSTQGYWVIRMKKSKDLCGSSTDKYHNMTNVKETYLYNKDV